MSEPIRLLSWNVWKMFGDPLAVHRVLRSARADLVCLQEAPAMPWSTWQLSGLARASGLRLVAGGRSAAGNAMLCSSRLRVHDAEAIRFPAANRWIQRRGAVLAGVSLGDGPPVQVAGVHLGLDRAERRAHVRGLLDRLVASGLPCVVAGDLNEPAGGPSWQAIAALAVDPAPGAAATYPARHPRRRIDAVLAAPGVEVLGYEVWSPDARDARLASDHLPVLTLIRPR